MSDFIPWRRSKERFEQTEEQADISGNEVLGDEIVTDVRSEPEKQGGRSVTSSSVREPRPDQPAVTTEPQTIEPRTDDQVNSAASSAKPTPAVTTRESLAGWKKRLELAPAVTRPSPRLMRETLPGSLSSDAGGSMAFRPTDGGVSNTPSRPETPSTASGDDPSRVDRGWGSRPDPMSAPAPMPRPLDRVGPRIMAVANQKGGVGKTTTTVNLGAAVAELGHRVLIIDLDPQGNASTGLGINPRSLDASMYDVLLHDVPLDDAIEAAAVRNLFVAPANLDLAGAEIELVPAFSREMRLKNAINSVADDFDLVLIDCPPSLGLLTVNAFAAATEVLVPIQCEYYALEGLGQLLRNVDLVKRNLNASLELSAIVLVMYDARTNLAAQVASEVREHFGSKVCRSVIPRTVRLSEAPSFGQPITVFDPTSRGALAYRDLAMEVVGEPT